MQFCNALALVLICGVVVAEAEQIAAHGFNLRADAAKRAVKAENASLASVAKHIGGPETEEEIDEQCRAEKAALLNKAQEQFDLANGEHKAEKRTMARIDTEHKEEVADVAKQEETIVQEKKQVAEAKADVQDSSHCPPELEEAKAVLAKLEAEPNKKAQDVDDECVAKKKVLKLQACVDELKVAEKDLVEHRDDHVDEKQDMKVEKLEAKTAAAAEKLQGFRVADAKADMKEASANLEKVKDGLDGHHSSAARAGVGTAMAAGLVMLFGI